MYSHFAHFPFKTAVLLSICIFAGHSHAAPYTGPELHNVSISLPENSRYNATQHLLCTPSSWKSIAPFFLANYFAHVATVRTIPGEPIIQVLAMMLSALFFPASGLARGLDAIFQSAKRGRSPLEVACKAGALCVVVRMPEWTPFVRPDRRRKRLMPRGTTEGVTWIDEDHPQQPLSEWASRIMDRDQGGPDNDQTSEGITWQDDGDISQPHERQASRITYQTQGDPGDGPIPEGITWQDESYLRQPHRARASRVINGDTAEPGNGHTAENILLNDIPFERSSHSEMPRNIGSSDHAGHDELPQEIESTVELVPGRVSVSDSHQQEIDSTGQDVQRTSSISHAPPEEIAPVSKQPTLENIHEIMAQSGWDQQGEPAVAQPRPLTAQFASMVYQFLPATNWYSWLGLSTHGVMDLPAGYALAILPYNFPMSRLEARSHTTMETASSPWYKFGIGHKSKKPEKAMKNESGMGPDVHVDGLSSAWNPAKAVVALFQILYASFTLYETQGDQIDRFGYAAFGLTVTPYLVMSVINLIGNITSPEFFSVYLVRDGVMDEVEQRTGTKFERVVGEIQEPDWENDRPIMVGNDNILFSESVTVSIAQASYKKIMPTMYTAYLVAAIPLAVIGGITRFHPGHSTLAERSWIMTWLIFGMVYGVGQKTSYSIPHRTTTLRIMSTQYKYKNLFLAFYVIATFGFLPLAAPAIGGFVVVGQMLNAYGDCKQLY